MDGDPRLVSFASSQFRMSCCSNPEPVPPLKPTYAVVPPRNEAILSGTLLYTGKAEPSPVVSQAEAERFAPS